MHKKRRKRNNLKKIFSIILVVLICIGIYEIVNKEKNISDSTEKKEVLLEDNDVKKSIFKKYYKKASELVSKMTIEEKVGQLFLVRYNKSDNEYLSNFYPGGYILFAKDFSNNTKDEMISELKENQLYNKYPLIIGVDEEGGFVTRVSRFKTYRDEKFLSPRDYYLMGGYDLLEKEEKEKAELLKSLGINLNLAPVADVSTNENDFINNRAFGEDANATSVFVKNMVRYANNNKINSCLKHFPGYGNNADTHTGVAIDNRSYEEISTNDYLPFIAGIEENVPCILVSHNVVTSIDSNLPASLSKSVHDELRNKLNFTGIIITDDLDMDAVDQYTESHDAATMAINAGNDMIITSDFISMKNEILKSVNNGIIDEKTINKAVIRIIAWKYYSGLFDV